MNMVNFSRLLRSTPTSHESVCRWPGTPQRTKQHSKGFRKVSVVLIEKDTKKSSTLIISQQKSEINCWIISSFLTVTINWYPFFTGFSTISNTEDFTSMSFNWLISCARTSRRRALSFSLLSRISWRGRRWNHDYQIAKRGILGWYQMNIKNI